MTRYSIRTRVILFAVALFAVLGGIQAANRKKEFNARDKAFFADARTISFVRPGLALKIVAAEILPDRTIRARVQIADPKGVPLDREGINTPGVVALSFVAAYIPSGQTQYTSYTTRTQVSTLTGKSAIQAGSDTGGTFTKTAEGEYLYTFGTKALAGYETGSTHTIGVYSNRNLTEFDLGTNFASATFNFVPAGGKVEVVRDVIKAATCNSCHGELNAHGGSRRGIEMCVLCHTPQTVDPDTGNTVDMKVMAHKIHAGSSLPSVKAGGKYQIIGNGNRVIDYSKVGFPSDIRNCNVCHVQSGTNAATQATNMYQPNRAACGSCHDDLDFAAGKGHFAATDNQCSECHRPDGKDFDLSIRGSHQIPEYSAQLPGTKLAILDIKDGIAGKKPIVTFAVKDAKGNPIRPADMTSLAIIMAGDTKEYTTLFSESAIATPMAANGEATYTFTNAIPASSKGSFTISMTGYKNANLTKRDDSIVTVRDAAINVWKTFSIDNSPVAQRRKVVSIDKCNVCHFQLAPHGRNRNQIETCVLCHTPSATDVARRPPAQGASESIHLGTMIHRIHAGNRQIRDYTIIGFGGSVNNFNSVGFPNELNNCASCHVNGSEALPLPETNLNVSDPRGWIPSAGPAAAVCSGCHVSKAAASHFLLNASQLGEGCAVCHGPNADYAVSKVHAK